VITASTVESIAMAQRLAREEGIFCGISSGCNVAAALKLVIARPEVRKVVVLANDTGQRYFSTALCGADKHVDVPHRDHPLDSRSRKLLDQYQGAWDIIE
jgi:cysteine synthase A